jgi:hypothetical protein
MNRVLRFLALISPLAAGACAALYGVSDVPEAADASTDSPSSETASAEGAADGSTATDGTTPSDGATTSDGGDARVGDGATTCSNLQCQVHACADGGTTTLSGRVLDPAGRNPVRDVVVYVPNSPNGQLDPIPLGVDGTSCSCGAPFSGQPLVVGITDVDGRFTLSGVPDGAGIPLVIQRGKWRKEITVATVAACAPNAAGSISMPKSLSDGAYASMPSIAVATGGADTLECILSRMGLDDSVFTGSPTGPGVHVFQGAGGNAAGGSPSSVALWDSTADLERYDLVMTSCEGAPTTGVTGTTAGYLGAYLNAGGRVFAEHFGYAFFTSYGGVEAGPPAPYPQFQNIANWTNVGLASNDQPYTSDVGAVVATTLPSGKPFPDGVDLSTWLTEVGALNPNGEIFIPTATARANAIVTGANVSLTWMQTDPSVTPASTQLFTWDMPFGPPVDDAGVPEYCGEVAYTDMHVSAYVNDYPTNHAVPGGCDHSVPLSTDEDPIEFTLFELTGCISRPTFVPPVSP